MKDSAISWTDHTFNAWWGCDEVSPACDFCYARIMATRWGYDIWGKDKDRRMFGEKHWKALDNWNSSAIKTFRRPARVFAFSMADIFEVHPQARAELPKFWYAVSQTPNLHYLLLTKRWNEIRKCLPQPQPRNTFVGVTVESAAYTYRITDQVEWLSMEPLLSAVDLTRLPRRDINSGAIVSLNALTGELSKDGRVVDRFPNGGLKWVVVGGGSLSLQQPMELSWALDLLAQCRRYGVAFHFKQTGDALAKELGISEMEGHDGKRDLSGKVPRHWPPKLRVQEFPDFNAIILGRENHGRRDREINAVQYQ